MKSFTKTKTMLLTTVLAVLLLIAAPFLPFFGGAASAIITDGPSGYWDGASNLWVRNGGLLEKQLAFTRTTEEGGTTYATYAANSARYLPEDKWDDFEDGDITEDDYCLINVSAVIVVRGLAPVTAATPSTGTLYANEAVDLAGAHCAGDVVTEALGNLNEKTIEISNPDNFINPLEDPESTEEENNRAIVVYVRPGSTAEVGDEIDESLVPESDDVTLKNSAGTVLDTIEAPVRFFPGDGTDPPGFNYSATFMDISAGTYEACSALLESCVSISKVLNQVATVEIVGTEDQAMDISAPDGDSNDSVAPPSCESQNSILLSWLLCSVLDLVDNTIVGIGNAADDLLNIPGDYYEGNPQLKAVWSYFRAIATFLLLGVGLFVVISQALGDLLGAYTVKKILPRLVIAAILIQLSWELFTLMIQVVNQIAWGIEGLMYAPFGGKGAFDFKNIVSTAGGSANGIFVAAAAGLLGSAVIGGSILSLAFVALVGLLIGFGFLLFRQVLVVVLLLIAPIALLCWILPNTEKFWKLWWESFSKLLLMYPIILFMIAGGRIFAWVAAGVDPGGQEQNLFEAVGVNDIVTVAIITIGYFGPFFLIPKAFQAAGGAFSTITGMANDRTKGFFDNQRKARAEKRKGRIERAGSNSLWNQKQGGWRGAMAKRANTAASWAVAPGSNAAYKLKDTNLPFSRSGRRIASQIEHAGVEQTQKLQQVMNGAGANDKTYRVLGGMHSGLSDPVKERFRDAGLYGRELTSEKDILKAAEIMATSDSDTEQLASGALHGLAPTLSSLYADPEMTKASVAGAAAIGLASHGFAGGEDLAHVGNMLKEQHGLPFAQTVVGQAQLAGARSRPDVKNGYGVVLDNDGNFVDGMSEEGGRAEAVLATIGVGDIAGAKGGFLTKMGGTIKNAIERGDTDGARDAFTRVAQLRPELKARIRQENPNMSQADVDQLAARQLAEIRDPSGNSIVDMANDYKLAKSLKEELFLAASQFSSAPIDTKGQATEMLTELGLSKELSEHDIKAAQRQGLDAGAGAAAAAAEPPAPTGPTTT